MGISEGFLISNLTPKKPRFKEQVNFLEHVDGISVSESRPFIYVDGIWSTHGMEQNKL